MALNIPIVNGVQHSYADIVVSINGTRVIDISSVSYSEKQEKTNLYGTGNQPTGRSRGKKEYEGSLTIRLSELQSLRDAAPNRSILDIAPFDIVVSYLPEGGLIINEILKNVEFMEAGIDSSEGDASIDVEVPFIMSHIQYD